MQTFLPAFLSSRPSASVSILAPLESCDFLRELRVKVIPHSIPPGSPLLRTYVDQILVNWHSRPNQAVLSLLNHGPILTGRPHILWARNELYFRKPTSASGYALSKMALAAMRTADCVIFPSISSRLSAERCGFHGEARVIGHPFEMPEPTNARRPQGPLTSIMVPTSPQAHKNLGVLRDVSTELSKLGIRHLIDVTAPQPHFTSELGGVRSVERFTDHQILTTYDCILLPSLVESFSYPLLEAQVLGIPVAASDIPAHRELGALAALFDPKDPAAAARAVTASIRAEPSDAAALRKNLRERHSPAKYATTIWQIIDETARSGC